MLREKLVRVYANKRQGLAHQAYQQAEGISLILAICKI